jgi:ribosomal-protein-alanine N-acetyltransferase
VNALPQQRTWRRAMTVADLDAVTAIEVLAYAFPWTRGNFTDSLAAGYLAEVLEAADGGLMAYFLALPGVDELHLLNLTVAPAHQRQGHGRALLEALADLGRQRGMATLWLEVRLSNARARALYGRSGFEEVGVRPRYYPAAGGREDAVVMRRALAAGDTHALD